MRLTQAQLQEKLDRAYKSGYDTGVDHTKKKQSAALELMKLEAATKLMTSAGQFQHAISNLLLSHNGQL